jgi:hypothetical protein
MIAVGFDSYITDEQIFVLLNEAAVSPNCVEVFFQLFLMNRITKSV